MANFVDNKNNMFVTETPVSSHIRGQIHNQDKCMGTRNLSKII